MIIAYILATFPNLTETFILNEITALKQRGLDIRILSIQQGNDLREETADRLQSIQYGEKDLFNKLSAHLYCIRSLKLKYFQVVGRCFFSRDQSFGDQLRLVKAFSISIYFLYQLRACSVQHIHAHFINLPATVAWFMWRLSGIPYSCSAHAYDIYKGNAKDIERKIVHSKFTVTCTAANRQYLYALCKNRHGHKINHIYHGIDVSKWSFRNVDDRRTGTVHILSVGRLVEKKGFNHLLEAMAILVQQGIDVECSIVGDGPLLGSLKSQAKMLAIEGKVIFHGSLSHERVKHIYKDCDLFVLPCMISDDGDRDGLPNVLLEAMAQGIPVISSNVSAIPELVRHRHTGLLIESHDARAISMHVIELINNPRLRHYLSANGRRVVETEFGIDQCVSQLEKLFLQLN